MPNTDRADSPAGGDGGEGLKDEAAGREARVRDGERTRTKLASAPKDDVEIEHARTPAAAGAAAELAFKGLHARQHLRRLEVALDQRDGIGKIAPSATVGGIEDDRRGIEQAKLLIEPGDRRLDHACGPAEPAMRAVRTDGDRVEVLSHPGALPTPSPP